MTAPLDLGGRELELLEQLKASRGWYAEQATSLERLAQSLLEDADRAREEFHRLNLRIRDLRGRLGVGGAA